MKSGPVTEVGFENGAFFHSWSDFGSGCGRLADDGQPLVTRISRHIAELKALLTRMGELFAWLVGRRVLQ